MACEKMPGRVAAVGEKTPDRVAAVRGRQDPRDDVDEGGDQQHRHAPRPAVGRGERRGRTVHVLRDDVAEQQHSFVELCFFSFRLF